MTYVSEVNPFIDEMKQYHFSLFKEIKAACEKVFQNSLNVIQDTFISFIALHFLNSYENVFDRKPKIRALYVCSTGRGVARLIKNRVEREIKDFILTSYCSVTEVEETCENENIDLIISVFPINSNIPVIIVEPVPTKENIQTIQEEVDNLLQGRETVESFLIDKGDDYQFEMDTEIISQEIIIKGFEVSDEIMTTLADRVTEEHKKGLNVHLFLMIHRYYFNKQYDQFIHQSKEQNKELLEQINAILHKHNIYIKESEQRALLEYFN
jgi:transcriptional antiterminator